VDASVDASTTDGGATPDAGQQLVCAPRADGGASWRDFAAGVCKACPASSYVGCSDLIGGGASFDLATRVLTVHVTPGLAEVVSASLQFDPQYYLPDGGFGSGARTAPGTPRGNTITWDLAPLIPGTLTAIYNGYLTLTDACGTVSTDTGDVLEVQLSPNPDGGRQLVRIDCGAL
jgi:hypothetical protein